LELLNKQWQASIALHEKLMNERHYSFVDRASNHIQETLRTSEFHTPKSSQAWRISMLNDAEVDSQIDIGWLRVFGTAI
jgi:hypothetical protein